MMKPPPVDDRHPQNSPRPDRVRHVVTALRALAAGASVESVAAASPLSRDVIDALHETWRDFEIACIARGRPSVN